MAKQPTPVGLPVIGKELLRIPVTWDKSRIIQDLAPDVEIELSPAALNKALADQPGRYAWWGMLEVKARKVVSILEQQIKVKRAELYTAIKAANEKATVDQVKAAVEVHPELLKLLDDLIGAQEDQEAVRVGREAMHHRKDALVTISANMRAEMESGISGAKERLEDFLKGRKGKGNG
jgi:hypothetical protein